MCFDFNFVVTAYTQEQIVLFCFALSRNKENLINKYMIGDVVNIYDALKNIHTTTINNYVTLSQSDLSEPPY